MKHLLTITFLIYSFFVGAQNYVGASKFSVRQSLEESGYVIHTTTDDNPYDCYNGIFLFESEWFKSYVFCDNICVAYELVLFNVDYFSLESELNQTLIKTGENKWQDELGNEVFIEWDKALQNWGIFVVAR